MQLQLVVIIYQLVVDYSVSAACISLININLVIITMIVSVIYCIVISNAAT